MSGQSILNNLDFANIIGGPLDATIKAQSDSAFATLEYINSIGFSQPRKPKNSTGALLTLEEAESAVTTKADKVEDDKDLLKKAQEGNDNTKIETATKNLNTSKEALAIAQENLSLLNGGEMGDVRYVSFMYEIAGEDGQQGHIKVPLLTIVPVPYLSIHSLDIDFAVKINDVVERESESSRNFGVSYSARKRKRGRSTRFGASYSNKSSSRQKQTHQAEYSMGVKIHAENVDMPAGLSRILGILEANLISQDNLVE